MNKHHTIPYHTIPYHTIPYHTNGICHLYLVVRNKIRNKQTRAHLFQFQFNSLFQTHLRSLISHNYMSQRNRNMQKQHINDSLCSLAYTLAASFFFGVYSWLVKVLGQFSIIYFRGLGLRIGVRVWVRVRVGG